MTTFFLLWEFLRALKEAKKVAFGQSNKIVHSKYSALYNSYGAHTVLSPKHFIKEALLESYTTTEWVINSSFGFIYVSLKVDRESK